jgi:hypothetical protein
MNYQEKLTRQGVPDLNTRGINGTRRCRHFYGPLRAALSCAKQATCRCPRALLNGIVKGRRIFRKPRRVQKLSSCE